MKKKNNNKRKVNKKGVLSKRSLYLITLIGIMVIIGIGGLVYRNVTKNSIPSNITKEVLQEKVTKAINSYEYADTQMATMIEADREISVIENSILSSCRSMNSTKSFIGMDKTYNINSTIVWESNDLGSYDVYLSDMQNNVTVKTELENEPINVDPWGIVKNTDKYILHNEFIEYCSKKCYLLLFMGNDEENNLIGEEMYIDSETFLPIGLVTYAQISNAEDNKLIEEVISEYGEIDNGNIKIDEIKATMESVSEYTLVYTFKFSNEPMSLVPIPKTYLTEEEYVKFKESLKENNNENK